MTIQKKLSDLLFYYESTRRIGHTTLMKKGTDNYGDNKCILAFNMEHGNNMGFKPKEIITLQNLDRTKGSSRPMAIDNGTMIVLLTETLKEFGKLEREIIEYEDKLIKIKKIIG
jgi:hypothetical protein